MKNPIQPLALDEHGVMRFKKNKIVEYLLDTHPTCDLNKIASMNFTNDDRQQLAQLIGYSLNGYSELQSYVDDEAYYTAAKMADSPETAEKDAVIEVLREKIDNMRDAISALHAPMAVLFEMHEEDLKKGT